MKGKTQFHTLVVKVLRVNEAGRREGLVVGSVPCGAFRKAATMLGSASVQMESCDTELGKVFAYVAAK